MRYRFKRNTMINITQYHFINDKEKALLYIKFMLNFFFTLNSLYFNLSFYVAQIHIRNKSKYAIT